MEEKSKVGRPTKLNEDIKKRMIKYAEMGFTDKEMATVIGVTEQTINNWKLRDVEFFESLKAAKLEADEQVYRALFKRATGFKKTERKAFVVSKGADIGAEIQHADVETEVDPNVTAQIFFLKNRQPDKFREKVEHTAEIDTTVTFNISRSKAHSDDD
jgi:hypothetical protein